MTTDRKKIITLPSLRSLCRTLVLGVSVPALFFCTTGCARQPGDSDSGLTIQEAQRQMDPSPMRLSQDAQQLYYNLLLADGLADNSHPVIAASLQKLVSLDPSPYNYSTGSALLLSRGDYPNALQMVKQGLTRYPDNTGLTLILTAIYTEIGKIPNAVELLESFIKRNPRSPEIAEALVRLYLNTGQDDKAATLMTVLPQTDKSPEGELFRANVLTTVGRAAEAKKILQGLVKKNPKFFEAWLELGYIAEGDKDFSEALKAYGKAAELMPDNEDLMLRLASLHISVKAPDKAMSILEKAKPTPVLFLQATARFFESGYTEYAQRTLDRAQELGGSADEINIVRSMIKQKLSGKTEDALAPLRLVPDSSPLYSSVLLQKAQIYLGVKQYEQMIAVARDGQKNFPQISEFVKLEAFGLVKTGKGDTAISLLEKHLKRSPNDEDMLYTLGTVLDEFGKKKEAMATMERLIKVNPKNYQALNYVGYSLAEQNTDLNRALTLVNTALEQYPDADYIMDSLAWVQYRLGRFEDAWKSINRCLELGGEEATIWEHYGDIALALGKKQEAVKGYAAAIEKQSENLNEIKQKLSRLTGKE
ncbi:tetratricopeptide repeat protein [Desulfovibrio sp. OttesenSCG-928-G15]|nr:tetratricopeptide repeat protein [Desulfovibrio sp. OttesenSCG-928-G15]